VTGGIYAVRVVQAFFLFEAVEGKETRKKLRRPRARWTRLGLDRIVATPDENNDPIGGGIGFEVLSTTTSV
jgi:hypothetical protein